MLWHSCSEAVVHLHLPASKRVACLTFLQARIELLLTLRRGESVLLTFLIPVLLLAFFASVDVLPTPDRLDDPVDFLVPGILALAVMSTAMVSLAIATGFERSTGVLKLLGSTPLTRRQLLVAKIAAIVVVELLQIAVLVVEGVLLGWEVQGAQVGAAVGALALATVAFAGLGMLMAGTLPALTTLAAANGLYIAGLTTVLYPADPRTWSISARYEF